METLIAQTPVKAEQSPSLDPARLGEFVPPQSEPQIKANTDTPENQSKSRLQKVKQAIAARAITEVVGVGVDAALMAAGAGGVGALANVGARETLASGIDVAVLNKLSPKDHETVARVGRPRLRKMGHLALSMGAAVAAQKIGPGVIEHVAANLNHGLGHFAVPLTSKIGATAGVNSFMKRRV